MKVGTDVPIHFTNDPDGTANLAQLLTDGSREQHTETADALPQLAAQMVAQFFELGLPSIRPPWGAGSTVWQCRGVTEGEKLVMVRAPFSGL
ncbi:MAG: hypothetical protein ICV77_16795, partial [Cyanobacteria bacterium Co-bin8]|nr:hypothetical protein [Cyanobacteria bacterium Co-bin8]